MSSRHVRLRLSFTEWHQLEIVAAREEDTISAIIREALYACYGIGAAPGEPRPPVLRCNTPISAGPYPKA